MKLGLMLRLLLILCSVFGARPTGAEIEKEVLPPERAFRQSVRLADADVVEVRYAIAEGYYLYRDKFKFSTETPGVSIGAPTLPPGKMKEDELFGKVETYSGDLVIRLPLKGAQDRDELSLKTQFQGCADAGICYTPQTRMATLKLAMAGSDSVRDTGGLLSKLKKLAGDDEPSPEADFLPVEKAFKVSVKAKDASTLVADLQPTDGYYLYRERTKLKLTQGEGVRISKVVLPHGEKKSDPNFGDTEVFHRAFQMTATLARAQGNAQAITAELSYQGCSEKGLCYPPTTRRVALTLGPLEVPGTPAKAPVVAPRQEVPLESVDTPLESSTPEPADETTQVAHLLGQASFWSNVLAFFGFGLLLAFTPCIFPMIPILSGIIVGQGTHLTRSKALVLTTAYVLGMALTYAAAGVAAGLSGSMLSAALQNAWVLGGFALVFVLLALSMFGFYDLQLPTAFQTRLTQASNKQRAGTLGGVFIMGALSALIVGPCVAAPLAGALVYIGKTHDVTLGGSALFAMALGMGAPLLLVGLSAGTLLPKVGAWMQTVKSFFGVLLLAVAIWLVSSLIPAMLHLLLWAGLLIVSAVYLHAVDPLPVHTTGWRKLWKGVGVIALLLGIAMLVGALSGARDPLLPLSGLRGADSREHSLQFEPIRNVSQLDERVTAAKGRPVLLDFYADWCVSCKEMERYTFADKAVLEKLRPFVLLRADVTANNADDTALLKRFELFGPPGILFFDTQGRQIKHRVIGYQTAEKFLRTLTLAEK